MSLRRLRPHVNPLSVRDKVVFAGFGNPKPIIVDVGAGKGEFVDQLRTKLPRHNFIVLEIRRPLAQWLQKKFASYKNIAVLGGDAGLNFFNIINPCLQDGARIKQIFINFPDPWLKNKHKKRRFLNATFLQQAKTKLPPRTEIILQTDQYSLFADSMALLREARLGSESFLPGSPYGIMSDWEQAKKKDKKSIWRVKIRKK